MNIFVIVYLSNLCSPLFTQNVFININENNGCAYFSKEYGHDVGERDNAESRFQIFRN